MNFGKVEPAPEHLHPIPEDHPVIDMLPHSDEPLTVHAAGARWGVPQWKGTWYPAGTPQKDFLKAYSRQFRCIELNATHYGSFSPQQFRQWSESVDEGFRFLPKIPQSVSHYRRLINTSDVLKGFIKGVEQLGKKAGPSFLQMPDHFSAEKIRDLYNWIEEWPDHLPLAIELRHRSWFESEDLVSELAAHFRVRNIGWVITDAPGRPDVLHMAVTSPDVLIRYAGWGGHFLETHRLQAWAERMAEWNDSGIRQVYFCIHQPDGLSTPETCIDLAGRIEKASRKVRISGIPERLGLF